MDHAFHRVAVVTFVGCVLAAGGCASSDGGRASVAVKATDSMRAVRDDLARGDKQVDKALAAIDQLEADGADLTPAFSSYTLAVSDLEASGDRVADRIEAMRQNREAYIQKWQQELEQVDNPDVRAALAERKAKVAANYDQIRDNGVKLRDDYRAFLKTLQEVERALALDLNPEGVAAMKVPLATARKQGAELKKSIAASRAEFDAILGRMTPGTAAKSS